MGIVAGRGAEDMEKLVRSLQAKRYPSAQFEGNSVDITVYEPKPISVTCDGVETLFIPDNSDEMYSEWGGEG